MLKERLDQQELILVRQEEKLEHIMESIGVLPQAMLVVHIKRQTTSTTVHVGITTGERTQTYRNDLYIQSKLERREARLSEMERQDTTSVTTGNCEEVTRRRMTTSKDTANKIRCRPDVFIICADGHTYTDTLKNIKHNKGVQDMSHNINMVSMTKTGHLRVVLKKDTKEEESNTQALLQAVEENAESFKLRLLSAAKLSSIDNVREVNKRKGERDTQLVTVSLPAVAAKEITASKLRIGYDSCRTKTITQVKKCYKCQ
ncbi:Hypothetical protein CINCED_3A014947 [Cinara cedri]|uniref:Uncharacterized protein n=1 Tax=Cinara cedri TaxID=506608 RepID=A0A5E4MK70_9HEMI|nr:Hypothetical protein CINCED_3A014947 [Cinara cedri]